MPMTRAAVLAVAVVAAVVAAAACAERPVPTTTAPGEPLPSPTTAAPAAPTTPTTVAEPPIAVPPEGLGAGATGELVAALERRLDALRYDVGTADDVFDADTGQGVVAFQKLHGLERTGVATPDVAAALATAQPPAPIVANGGPTRVEIDLPRQVLFLYEGGALHKILSISTGSGEEYYSPTNEDYATAVTPPGTYQVHYHVDGWDESPLGQLYRPVYFDPKNGLAHGFEEVPADPASHGCVRISMTAAEWFPDKAPKGTPVYVSDGQTPLQPV